MGRRKKRGGGSRIETGDVNGAFIFGNNNWTEVRPQDQREADDPPKERKAQDNSSDQFAGYLTRDEINILEEAFRGMRQSYDEVRKLLLNGVDAEFVEGLETYARPSLQLDSDLIALNGTKQLSNGTTPLIIWLENAANRFDYRTEGQEFRKALDKVLAHKESNL